MLRELARGLSEKEIADRLNISTYTAKNHLRNVRERFGLSKNTELLMLYICHVLGKDFSLWRLRNLGVDMLL